jgi:hypothetical protein
MTINTRLRSVQKSLTGFRGLTIPWSSPKPLRCTREFCLSVNPFALSSPERKFVPLLCEGHLPSSEEEELRARIPRLCAIRHCDGLVRLHDLLGSAWNSNHCWKASLYTAVPICCWLCISFPSKAPPERQESKMSNSCPVIVPLASVAVFWLPPESRKLL